MACPWCPATPAVARDADQLRMPAGVDAVVLGRVTYEMFASFRPGVTVDEQAVAGPLN